MVECTDAGSSSSSSDSDDTDVAAAGGEAVDPTGQKRKSTSGPTPLLASKKRPKRAKLGASFEQAEKDDLQKCLLDHDILSPDIGS